MKVGKVFEKQAARKQVASIVFGDSAAVITLAPGYTSNGTANVSVKNAHEARLFIDAAVLGQAPVEAATPAVPAARAAAPKTKTVQVANDNLITVDADWVRARTGGYVDLPESGNVRVTPRQMAALALMVIAA